MRSSLRAIASLAVLVALAACATLPDSGPVHELSDSTGRAGATAPYFAPPGPRTGDTPEAIVRGFLQAMQANPPSTAVARGFLTEQARSNWKPNRGTIVYDASTVEQEEGTTAQVIARLSDAHSLDSRGGWIGGPAGHATTLTMSLVPEKGEWRITDPVDALVVPASYFASLFVPFDLYFLDGTHSVLVADRVYIPRGEQTATNLVRGLLAGPSPRLRRIATSAFPPRTDLDLAVVVNDTGLAEVPLSQEILRLSPVELNRAVAQLSWTLRQVPGITRIRMTVDGAPVPFPDGRTDVRVDAAEEFDPLSGANRDAVVVSEGRVGRIVDDAVEPLGGPLGQAGFALRSVALRPGPEDGPEPSPDSEAPGADAPDEAGQVAAVSDDGRQLFVAPDRGPRAAHRVRTALTGTSLLRPVYDRFGGLWAIDRTAAGAVVHLVRGERERAVRVRGISGADVVAFTVTRDGAHLVAIVNRAGGAVALVSDLARSEDGSLRAFAARRVQLPGDPGPGIDVGQTAASSVVVAVQRAGQGEGEGAEGRADLVVVELDGSPGDPVSRVIDLPRGEVVSLATSPDPSIPTRVLADGGRLFEQGPSGHWLRVDVPAVTALAP